MSTLSYAGTTRLAYDPVQDEWYHVSPGHLRQSDTFQSGPLRSSKPFVCSTGKDRLDETFGDHGRKAALSFPGGTYGFSSSDRRLRHAAGCVLLLCGALSDFGIAIYRGALVPRSRGPQFRIGKEGGDDQGSRCQFEPSTGEGHCYADAVHYAK